VAESLVHFWKKQLVEEVAAIFPLAETLVSSDNRRWRSSMPPQTHGDPCITSRSYLHFNNNRLYVKGKEGMGQNSFNASLCWSNLWVQFHLLEVMQRSLAWDKIS
jgi:hypothetical protein